MKMCVISKDFNWTVYCLYVVNLFNNNLCNTEALATLIFPLSPSVIKERH